jgi:hypothetical protein
MRLGGGRSNGGFMHKVKVTFLRQEMPEMCPDVSYLEDTARNYEGLPAADIEECVRQDRERLRAFHGDEWYMIGIRAVAKIEIERIGMTTSYTLESPGQWNIESDSGEDYFREVFKDECDVLRDDLIAMGVSPACFE